MEFNPSCWVNRAPTGRHSCSSPSVCCLTLLKTRMAASVGSVGLYEALENVDEEAQVRPERIQSRRRSWPRIAGAFVVAGALLVLLVRFNSQTTSEVHTPPCPSGSNQCCLALEVAGHGETQRPAAWNDPMHEGGYHCLYKLKKQHSEEAYENSGGACRPASHGPFPSEDCQVGLHRTPPRKMDK
eukprot:s4905_g2.t1